MDGAIVGLQGKVFQCHDGDTGDTPALREKRIQLYIARINGILPVPNPQRLAMFTGKPYREDELIIVADDIKGD